VSGGSSGTGGAFVDCAERAEGLRLDGADVILENCAVTCAPCSLRDLLVARRAPSEADLEEVVDLLFLPLVALRQDRPARHA
jgi:hypothetical protein